MKGNDSALGGTERYHIQLVNLFDALEDMSSFVLQVGELAVLDINTITNLRFCLHELAANTIEHGVFDARQPELEATVIVDRASIEIVYTDNSAVFDTTEYREINIKEKISSGSRRGLGLFMLGKIVDDMRYRRRDNRNITFMRLRRECTDPSPPEDETARPDEDIVPVVA